MPALSANALFTLLISIAAFFSVMGKDLPIDLGLADPYAILAGSTVTSTGVVGTVVTGNIGIFPGTAITGFPPAVINGAIDSANGASGGAQGALTTAYDVAAAKPFNTTLSNMDLGGMILLPGVYRFDGAAALNGALTFDANGDAAAVWIFQIGSSLMVAGGSAMLFKDSIGNPDYVYWQIGTSATISGGVTVIGNFMAFASIVVQNGATVNGRCLARNAAVTLDYNVINKPVKASFSATQTVTGINLQQYNTAPVLIEDTFTEAITSTMTGVLPGDVSSFDVTSGSTSGAVSLTARALSENSITLDYIVLASSTSTAAQLQAQLAAAVENGEFNAFLHNLAVEYGIPMLALTSSDAVSTETIDTRGSSSSSDNNGLTDGDKAGISIGVILGFTVLMFTALWMSGCFKTDKSFANTSQQMQTA